MLKICKRRRRTERREKKKKRDLRLLKAARTGGEEARSEVDKGDQQ